MTLRRMVKGCAYIVFWSFVAGFVFIAILPEPQSGYSPPVWNSSMQRARAISLALYSYSQDNDGHYPSGKKSTEVFQQLLDGGYIADSSIFYNYWTPGKVRPQSNHLTSENTCWDVTCCVDNSAPPDLPVVFSTGYRVTYQAGAHAVPILPKLSPRPPNNLAERIWGVWTPLPYIGVAYYGNSACFITADTNGSIPNFIPADFDPKGKTYRQLTP
jgi:hypothetical protein